MCKIALGFVVFNPPPSLLVRMKLALSANWELFIYDNSPSNDTIRVFCNDRKGCHYFTAGRNVGLGYGMSLVATHAYYNNFSALLFFDQDTGFSAETLAFVERFYAANLSMADAYSSVVFNAQSTSADDKKSEFAVRDVLLSINSGTLYFLNNLKRLNWFDESFFVDCVDYEFCLRSSIANLKIAACTNTPGYDHVSEQEDVSYFVFGRFRRLRKYSHSRVVNTFIGMLRLCCRSVIALDGKYMWCLARSLAIYLFWQLVVRALVLFPCLSAKNREVL